MAIRINNLQYNLIKKGLARLDSCYSQSNDVMIRNYVKETVFYKIGEEIPEFAEELLEAFENCNMETLYSVEELKNTVLNSIQIEKIPHVDMSTIKKIFRKLQEKDQRAIYQGFNNAVEKNNFSYYTQTFDNKKAILYFNDGNFEGAVCETRANGKVGETCCHFCNTFRRGNEIEYLTLVDKGKNGNYKSKTITSCSDQEYCNEHILTMEPLIKFLKKEGKENGKETYRSQLGE